MRVGVAQNQMASWRRSKPDVDLAQVKTRWRVGVGQNQMASWRGSKTKVNVDINKCSKMYQRNEIRHRSVIVKRFGSESTRNLEEMF